MERVTCIYVILFLDIEYLLHCCCSGKQLSPSLWLCHWTGIHVQKQNNYNKEMKYKTRRITGYKWKYKCVIIYKWHCVYVVLLNNLPHGIPLWQYLWEYCDIIWNGSNYKIWDCGWPFFVLFGFYFVLFVPWAKQVPSPSLSFILWSISFSFCERLQLPSKTSVFPPHLFLLPSICQISLWDDMPKVLSPPTLYSNYCPSFLAKI